MEKFIIISIGAIIGANARYWVGGWVVERYGAVFIGLLDRNLLLAALTRR